MFTPDFALDELHRSRVRVDNATERVYLCKSFTRFRHMMLALDNTSDDEDEGEPVPQTDANPNGLQPNNEGEIETMSQE